MSQSSSIVAFLLIAFVLFIAAKGKLPNYTAVLWGNTKATVPNASGGGGGIGGTIKSAASAAKTVGEIAAFV